jgi:hypothetical protein
MGNAFSHGGIEWIEKLTALWAKEECMSQPAVVSAVTCRRLFRVGACPVLEVSVTYPRLDAEAVASAGSVARFNETYRALAEAFLAWAETAPVEEAQAAFAAMGASAPFRFDRRVLTCDVTAEWQGKDRIAKGKDAETWEGDGCAVLAVTRTARLIGRRGEVEERSLMAVDEWRWPELTLLPRRRRR